MKWLFPIALTCFVIFGWALPATMAARLIIRAWRIHRPKPRLLPGAWPTEIKISPGKPMQTPRPELVELPRPGSIIVIGSYTTDFFFRTSNGHPVACRIVASNRKAMAEVFQTFFALSPWHVIPSATAKVFSPLTPNGGTPKEGANGSANQSQ